MNLGLTGCEVNLSSGTVQRRDGPVRLTAKERGLLAHLAARPGQTVETQELLVEVWGYAPASSPAPWPTP